METRYAAGDGVLLGAGDHWVLVADPRDDEVLEQVWALLTQTHPVTGSVTEEVIAVLEKAFEGDPPALAVVDLSSGGSSSVSRGRGHVRVLGGDRILSLDGGADPGELLPTRRLVAGVVAASRAEIRPLAHRTAPAPSAAAPAPAPAPGMIDGIPEAILAAKGPEGPPPARPRRPVEPVRAAEDTGSLPDTTEPDPAFMERILQGGHTTIHPAQDAEPSPGPDGPDDHDGATVHRPAPAPHLRHGTTETVLAVSCPQGHLTSPSQPSCRVCRQRVAPQEPRRVDRPPLGGLRLPTGEVVPLDRGVVLGRKPAPVEGAGDWPHLVHLPSDHTFVSRMHLHIELDGWQVLARDLDSRGGTMLTMPGREPERMRAHEAYVLEPGASLDLAEVYEVRFESGPAAGAVGER
ncbi:FHA domain-containing protein [Nocardioides sp. Soil805]|uniref:FHA domain-containing protein n=1 Tax=Nocardioides sp. Soil805 TaxID=1736416 RepID=UPI0012E35F83|nr:FHA domain-containing protein [Nocardioides sp. Soil805]